MDTYSNIIRALSDLGFQKPYTNIIARHECDNGKGVSKRHAIKLPLTQRTHTRTSKQQSIPH